MKTSKGTAIWNVILVVICVALWMKVSALNTQNEEMLQELERISDSLGDTRVELYELISDIEDGKTEEELMAEELAYFKYDGFTSFGNGRLTMAGDLGYSLNIDENIESMELIYGDQTFEMNAFKEGTVFFEGSEEIDVSKAINDEVRVKILYIRFVTESGKEYKVYPEIYEWMSYQVKDQTFDDLGITQVYEVEVSE